MSDLLKDGEQMLEGERNNQQGQDQSQMTDQSQQSSGGSSSGGGFMQGMERNTEDAYINQEANQFLSKEGVPTAMDGAIDGAIDTEANKF